MELSRIFLKTADLVERSRLQSHYFFYALGDAQGGVGSGVAGDFAIEFLTLDIAAESKDVRILALCWLAAIAGKE